MQNRKAFTLLEVLISLALLGLIIVPLFSVVEMMRMSNANLLHALEKSEKETKATKVLFLDIASSDGRLTLKKDDFTRLCIEETKNSLYALPVAKVCWVVLKNKNTLARIEGYNYRLPLKYEDKVEVDTVMQGVELFDVYHTKDKVLVLLKEKGKTAISFMVQGVTDPVARVLGDGTQVFKDGSKILPDGTIVPAPQKKTNKKTQNNGQGVQPQGGNGGNGGNGTTQQTNVKPRTNGQNGGNSGGRGGNGQNKPLPRGQADGEPDIPIP